MSKLTKLSNIVTNIRKTSEKILHDAVPIAKDLSYDNSELIEDFIDEHPSYNDETARKLLQSLILDLIQDAEIVEKEIDVFEEVVCEGEEGIINTDGCDFFQRLWFGDIYDNSGIEALNELLIDLKKTSSQINWDYLIENASSMNISEPILEEKDENENEEDENEEEEK